MFPATVTRPSFMNLLRNFYRLAAPFWLTRQSWKAWLALGSAIACSLLFVQVVVLVARWDVERWLQRLHEERLSDLSVIIISGMTMAVA